MRKWNRIGFLWLLMPILLMSNACEPARKDLLAKATASREAGDVDAARQIYQGILDRHPYDADAIEGMVEITRSDPVSAGHSSWCRRLLQLRPWDRYANVVIGKEFLQEGDLKSAVARFYMAYQGSDFAQEKREVLALLEEAHTKAQERFQN